MSAAKKKERRSEKAYLEQIGGQGTGRLFELSRDTIRIGRTEDNEIVMKSDSVSRCHAFLRRNMAGHWIFQDNSSKNGVRVNGKRVLEAALNDGDLVVVGDFTFKFFGEAEGSALHNEKTSASIDYTPPKVTLEKTEPVWQGRAEKEHPIVTALKFSWDLAKKIPIVIKYLEQNSWIVGVLVGVIIGGGLWWKASKVGMRPGELPALPLKPAAEVQKSAIKPKPAPMPQEPATFASENQQEQEQRAQIAKEDLAVAPKTSKKPKSEKRDLKMYLKEGREYLAEGDKESAAIAFRFALVLDPANKEAKNGLRSAGVKVETPAPKPAPPKEERKPAADNRAKKVADLMKAAVEAFKRGSYQDAIDKAEAARRIEVPGQTEYLNEAKQVIDRARNKHKEDFEPFVESARQKIALGDYKGAAALCDEMLRTNPAYQPAKDCLAKSLDGIAGKGVK